LYLKYAINVEKYRPRGPTWIWPSEGFFRGVLGYFSKAFLGAPKVAKFVFSYSKLRKQYFLLNFSKSREGQGPLAALPMSMYVDATWLKSIIH